MSTRQKGGPITDAGKAVTRLNAVSHGLLSREVLLDGEDAKMLRMMTNALYAEMQPIGELESFLVDRLVAEMWRLRRALAAERAHATLAKLKSTKSMVPQLTYGSDDVPEELGITSVITDPDAEKIMRYATSIERSFYRTLHELQRLQATRNGIQVHLPTAVDVNLDGFSQD